MAPKTLSTDDIGPSMQRIVSDMVADRQPVLIMQNGEAVAVLSPSARPADS